jgi:hypothetical protein
MAVAAVVAWTRKLRRLVRESRYSPSLSVTFTS